MLSRQLSQKLPTPFVPRRITFFELFACPEDGPLGPRVETFGVEQGSLIVISQETHLARHHPVDTLARVRSVTNNVAETVNLRNPLCLNVRQNRIQRFQVTVDVTDESFQGPQAFRMDLRRRE
jgi:hypothetical protein